MTSLTRWTWVWVTSSSWWWTGKPGVLQSMGSQSWTQLSNWTELIILILFKSFFMNLPEDILNMTSAYHCRILQNLTPKHISFILGYSPICPLYTTLTSFLLDHRRHQVTSCLRDFHSSFPLFSWLNPMQPSMLSFNVTSSRLPWLPTRNQGLYYKLLLHLTFLSLSTNCNSKSDIQDLLFWLKWNQSCLAILSGKWEIKFQ